MLLRDIFEGIKCPNCGSYHDATLRKCPECNKSNELFRLRRIPKRVVFLHPFAQIGMFLVGFAYGGMLIMEIIVALFKDYLPSDAALRSITGNAIIYISMFIGLLAIALLSGRIKIFGEKFTNSIDYVYGIGYATTIVFSSIILGAILSWFYKMDNNVNQEAIETVAHSYPLLSIPVLCFVGPICEELTYRVGLYSFLRRFNKYLAFVITVIVFAFIHFEFGADDILTELRSLPVYMVSGFILTLAYEHRGPACSMTAHVLYNSFALALVFIAK